MSIQINGQHYWVNTQQEAGRRFVFYNDKIWPCQIGCIGAVVSAIIVLAGSWTIGSIEAAVTWIEAVAPFAGGAVGGVSSWRVARWRSPDLAQLSEKGIVSLQYGPALAKLREQVESVRRLEAGGWVSKYQLDDADVDQNLISEYLRITREDYELLGRHNELDYETSDALKAAVATVTRRYMRRIRNDVDRKRRDRALLEAPEREAIRDSQERRALTVQVRAEQRLSEYRDDLVG